MRKFRSTDAEFAQQFDAFLSEQREASADVRDTVTEILASIRKHGDNALLDATRKFDRMPALANVSALRVDAKELAEARQPCRDAGPRWSWRRHASAASMSGRSRKTWIIRMRQASPGRAVETARRRGAVCARRHRVLPELGADERRPGPGSGRKAPRHG